MTSRRDPDKKRGFGRRFVDATAGTTAPSIRASNLLFALKAAIATGLAWPAALLLPGAVDEYSYYAPLGALIALTPTIVGSLRSSLQTALGIAIGIALAWAVLATPLPVVVSVPLAVGIGAIVAGFRGLGPGSNYVPVAALLVLIIGGRDAEDFSLGYLLQMAVGMAIGLAVNLIIVPPLYQRESAAEIATLRRSIADKLDDFAEALAGTWPPENTELFTNTTALYSSVRAAAPIVQDARESRRINPRKRWNRYDMKEDLDDLNALSWLSTHTRDLGEAISTAASSDSLPGDLPEKLRLPLSDSLASTASLIRAWDERSGETEAAETAGRALTSLVDLHSREDPNEISGAVIFDLRRMLAIVNSRRRAHEEN